MPFLSRSRSPTTLGEGVGEGGRHVGRRRLLLKLYREEREDKEGPGEGGGGVGVEEDVDEEEVEAGMGVGRGDVSESSKSPRARDPARNIFLLPFPLFATPFTAPPLTLSNPTS